MLGILLFLILIALVFGRRAVIDLIGFGFFILLFIFGIGLFVTMMVMGSVMMHFY